LPGRPDGRHARSRIDTNAGPAIPVVTPGGADFDAAAEVGPAWVVARGASPA
jgi:hypothetical protein